MRARLIKPTYFRDVKLLALPPLTRLLFAGLWTLADREGRLEDAPLQIKMDVLPLDDVDVEALLNDLAGSGFICRYHVDGRACIQVVNFLKHQRPHARELASALPAPCVSDAKHNLGDASASPRRSLTLNPIPLTPNHKTASVDAVTEAAPDGAVAQVDESEDGAAGWGLLSEEPTTPAPAWPDAPWIDAAFDEAFWPTYPRKTHKAEAKACWRKLMKRQPAYETAFALAEQILEALSEQADYWTDPALTPHPATYLNNERWTDEQIIPTGRRERSPPQRWAP
jgi:hypothetical protein